MKDPTMASAKETRQSKIIVQLEAENAMLRCLLQLNDTSRIPNPESVASVLHAYFKNRNTGFRMTNNGRYLTLSKTDKKERSSAEVIADVTKILRGDFK